jgi:hypothetical protein
MAGKANHFNFRYNALTHYLYKHKFVELKLESSIALSQICFPEHPQLFRIQAPSSGSPALSSLSHHICH